MLTFIPFTARCRLACVTLSIPLLTACLLTACAGVTRTALKPETKTSISSVKSELFIPADELIVRAKPSNIAPAMGYGLIPALIDASVSASRQTELEAISNPYYAKTDQIDFRSSFMTAFNTCLQTQQTLPALTPKISTRGISKTALASYKAQLSPGEAFLGIRIWYEFSTDLRSVMVGAGALLVSKTSEEPVYKNSFIYVSSPMNAANPLAAWSENDGQALQQAYVESGEEIAKMLQQDLAGPANDTLFAELAKQEKVQYTLQTAMPLSIKGYVVDQTERRKTIRSDSGELFSFSK